MLNLPDRLRLFSQRTMITGFFAQRSGTHSTWAGYRHVTPKLPTEINQVGQQKTLGVRFTSVTAIPAAAVCCSAPSETEDLSNWVVCRIAGDGNCMFRALTQGAHCAEQIHTPSSPMETTLLPPEEESTVADHLRHAICDALLDRRQDIEPFIDTDFDTYVSRMRKSGTWGGEPELAMAPHVLHRPISVYSFDSTTGSLRLISQYETSIGNDINTKIAAIPLLFHGYGHYELLLRSPATGPQARL